MLDVHMCMDGGTGEADDLSKGGTLLRTIKDTMFGEPEGRQQIEENKFVCVSSGVFYLNVQIFDLLFVI